MRTCDHHQQGLENVLANAFKIMTREYLLIISNDALWEGFGCSKSHCCDTTTCAAMVHPFLGEVII